MDAQWSQNPCTPRKSVFLTITVRWAGEARRYAVRPPQLDVPKGLVGHSVTSRSFRAGQENVIAYQWELRAEEKALIAPFPVKLTVFEHEETEPFVLEIETEPLEIGVSGWKAIPVRALVLSGFLAAVAVTGLLVFLRKRRAPSASPTACQEKDSFRSPDSLLEELRKSQVRGDTLSFLQKALKIQNFIPAEGDPDVAQLHSLLYQAKYGGLRLSSEEMEGWIRRLKRRGSSTNEPKGTHDSLVRTGRSFPADE